VIHQDGTFRPNDIHQRDLDVTRLATKIRELVNLSSFSLYSPFRQAASISRGAIISLLEALPSSCASLELDTAGYDGRHSDRNDDEAHICDSLRAVLPRMRYARIRISTMCSAMFGFGPDPHINNNFPDASEDEDEDARFQPISLKNMRSLLVNCVSENWYALQRCSASDWNHTHLNPGSPRSSWLSITAALERLVETEGAICQDANIMVMGHTVHHDSTDMAIWQAYIRANIVAKESHLLPHRLVCKKDIADPWLVRIPGPKDLLTSAINIEPLAEDYNWVPLYGGSRLPRAIAEDEMRGRRSIATGCVSMPAYLKPSHKWLQENPGQFVTHWLNENMCGRKLFQAEVRVGDQEYLSLEPIREITPGGWVRGPHNRFLMRMGTYR